jgi:hypothetical protein
LISRSLDMAGDLHVRNLPLEEGPAQRAPQERSVARSAPAAGRRNRVAANPVAAGDNRESRRSPDAMRQVAYESTMVTFATVR